MKLSTGLVNAIMATGSFRSTLNGFELRVYSGAEPATADDAIGGAVLIGKYDNGGSPATFSATADDGEGATPLLEITVSSGSFTPGTPTSGLNFAAPASGACAKAVGEVWSGAATSSGTAGWFRFYANDRTTGADTSHARFDGSVSTSGAQLNMSSTAITAGATTTIDSFVVTMPAS